MLTAVPALKGPSETSSAVTSAFRGDLKRTAAREENGHHPVDSPGRPGDSGAGTPGSAESAESGGAIAMRRGLSLQRIKDKRAAGQPRSPSISRIALPANLLGSGTGCHHARRQGAGAPRAATACGRHAGAPLFHTAPDVRALLPPPTPRLSRAANPANPADFEARVRRDL